MKRIFCVVVLLGFAACGIGTEPESEFALSFNLIPADTIMEGDTVIFTRGELNRLRDLRPVSVSATGGGAIRVLGSFVTGCSGPLPEASVERQPDRVILKISFPPEGPLTCADMPAPYTYEARFTRVPSGGHRLVVQHFGDYLRPDGTVFEEQVQVN
jgi:hypothetical protein